jgi:hypothetical protein
MRWQLISGGALLVGTIVLALGVAHVRAAGDDNSPPPPRPYADSPGDPSQQDPPPPPPQDQNGDQGGNGPTARPSGNRPPRMPPELHAMRSIQLTDEQKQKVDPILRAFGEKQRALRDDLLKQLKEVLDADQFEQFQRAFVPPRPPGPPPQALDDSGPTTRPPNPQ